MYSGYTVASLCAAHVPQDPGAGAQCHVCHPLIPWLFPNMLGRFCTTCQIYHSSLEGNCHPTYPGFWRTLAVGSVP